MKGQRSTSAAGRVSLRVGQPFNPFKLFTGIFIPEALVRYRGPSSGAKLAYGRLARYAGENGECWPSIPTLAAEIGMGATQARTYVHELSAHHFITIERRPGTSGIFRFLWHQAFAGEIGKRRKVPPLRKTGGVPLQQSGPLPLRKTGDEENHHQESQIKESQIKESQIKESQFAVPAEKTETPDTSSSHSVDDDENSHGAPAYASSWDELSAMFQKASGGTTMRLQDEYWLKEQMELRGITPEGVVKLVHENPLNGFRSPMAGLKWLVKKFGPKTRSGKFDAVTSAVAACLVPTEAQRCEKCGNAGRILERIEGEVRPRMTGQYCDCRMGKELEAVEKRKQRASILYGRPGSEARPLKDTRKQYAAT